VSAEFEAVVPVYTITVTVNSPANGTVTSGAATANEGATVTLTVQPNTGYRLKAGSLRVDKAGGGAVTVSGAGTAYSFTMPAANVTVSAEFEAVVPVYTITVTVNSPANGTVTSGAANAIEGATVTLTVQPSTGYRLKTGSPRVNNTGGGTVPVSGSGTAYSFTMPASNVTVSAEFEAVVPVYTVTVNPSLTNGTVTPGGANAVEGATVTLTVQPNTGYQLKAGSPRVNNAGGGAVPVSGAGTAYSFTMPASNVTVSAEFEAILYAITIDSSMLNGTVTPSPSTASIGTPVALNVQPASGYYLKAGSLRVDKEGGGAVPVSGSGPYSFTMPAANVTVSAAFELPGSGDITLSLSDLGQRAFTQNTFTVNKGGTPNLATKTVSLDPTETWDPSPAPAWDIDNGLIFSTGSSVTISAANLNTGGHSLTVTVYKNGVPWSKTLRFTVGN
jgi:hypothetical protein